MIMPHTGGEFIAGFDEGDQVDDLFAGQHIQQALGHG